MGTLHTPNQGGILLGGDLVVLAGTTDAAPAYLPPGPDSAEHAASASTLSGNYHIGAFLADANAPPPHFSSFTGTGSSDGVSTVTTNTGGTINIDGVVGPFPAAVTNDSYTVAADGTLSVTIAGTTLVGGVSPTGDYAVLAAAGPWEASPSSGSSCDSSEIGGPRQRRACSQTRKPSIDRPTRVNASKHDHATCVHPEGHLLGVEFGWFTKC